MKIEVIFGQVLRQTRLSNKLSQEKLSQECGLDRSYISLLERGLRQPSLKTILLLSTAMNTSASKMVYNVEEAMNENSENSVLD